MSRVRLLCPMAAVWITLVALEGCVSPDTYRPMMQSADPLERAKGCRYAGRYGGEDDVPLLVDRLEDTDRAVRMMANLSLREITGEDFGYRESDPQTQRAVAIQKWRAYAAGLNPSESGG